MGARKLDLDGEFRMKKMQGLVFGLYLFTAVSVQAAEKTDFDQKHQAFSTVLKTYMKDSKVNYGRLKADLADAGKPHPFKQYLEAIQGVKTGTFESWNQGDQMAYLINSYNALTIKLIADHYPVASIKDIGGIFTKPWSVKFFSILDGAIKSIDPIEHDYLRPRFKDYRVHAAVNCASTSCPPLRGEAYVGARLGEQLDEQMMNWIADTTRNQFDEATGTAKISMIFKWYAKDFDTWGGGVSKVLSKFGNEKVKGALTKNKKLEYLDYDWGLNDSK